MLYSILYSLHDYISCFNIFRYLTFRAMLAALTSLLFTLFIGKYLIKWLQRFQIGQVINENAPVIHQNKAGTPTMGGLLIIFGIFFSTICWANLANKFIWISLFSLLWLGGLGFIDDYIKLKKKNSKGLIAKYKLLGQCILGIILALYFFCCPSDIAYLSGKTVLNSNYQTFLTHNYNTQIVFPFMKDIFLNLGLFYFLFVILVVIASSNACNLTDGLDGLATGCMIFVGITYGIFAYLASNWKTSQYLNMLFVEGSGELVIICASIIGAGLGFLWFNSYPASIFMGDTGSLALGGLIGVIALIIKKEVWLFIVGGIFVVEILSVILQVSFYKLTKRRIFRMAPIHHHFELLGWAEPKIVVRFWIIAIILMVFALITLKIV